MKKFKAGEFIFAMILLMCMVVTLVPGVVWAANGENEGQNVETTQPAVSEEEVVTQEDEPAQPAGSEEQVQVQDFTGVELVTYEPGDVKEISGHRCVAIDSIYDILSNDDYQGICIGMMGDKIQDPYYEVTDFDGVSQLTCDVPGISIENVTGNLYRLKADSTVETGDYTFFCEIDNLLYKLDVEVDFDESPTAIIENCPNQVDMTASGAGTLVIKSQDASDTYKDYGVFKIKSSDKAVFTFSGSALKKNSRGTYAIAVDIEGSAVAKDGYIYKEFGDWRTTDVAEGDKTLTVGSVTGADDYAYVICDYCGEDDGTFDVQIKMTAKKKTDDTIFNPEIEFTDTDDEIESEEIEFEYDSHSDEYVCDYLVMYSTTQEMKSGTFLSLNYLDANLQAKKIEIDEDEPSVEFTSKDGNEGQKYRLNIRIEKADDCIFSGEFVCGANKYAFDQDDFDANHEYTIKYKYGTAGSKYTFTAVSGDGDSGIYWDTQGYDEDSDTYDVKRTITPSTTTSAELILIKASDYGYETPITYTVNFVQDKGLNITNTDFAAKSSSGQTVTAVVNRNEDAINVSVPAWADSSATVSGVLTLERKDVKCTIDNNATATYARTTPNIINLGNLNPEIAYTVTLTASNGTRDYQLNFIKEDPSSAAEVKEAYVTSTYYKTENRVQFKSGEGTSDNPYMAVVRVPDKAFSTNKADETLKVTTAEFGNISGITNVSIAAGKASNIFTDATKKASKTLAIKGKDYRFSVTSADGTVTNYYRVLVCTDTYGDVKNSAITVAKLKYTGVPLEQSNLKVTLNGVTLIEGLDYDTSYANNTELTTRYSKASVTVNGIGPVFSGTKSQNFEIIKGDQTGIIHKYIVDLYNPEPDKAGVLYVGKNYGIIALDPENIVPGERAENVGVDKATVKSSNTRIATVTYNKTDKNWTITPKAAGKVNINITTPGNAKFNAKTISRTVYVEKKKQLSSIKLSQSKYTYDGTEKKPEVTVKSGTAVVPNDGSVYEVEYINNVDAGTAKVNVSIVEDNFDYGGKLSKTFTIAKKNQELDLQIDKTALFTVTDGDTATIKLAEPSDGVNVGAVKATSSYATVAKVVAGSEGSNEYYVQALKPGTTKVTLNFAGDNNYNKASKAYTIVVQKPAAVTASNITVPVTQQGTLMDDLNITVKLGKATLTKGTDYDLVSSDTSTIGTGTATILLKTVGATNKGEEVTKSFSVIPRNIDFNELKSEEKGKLIAQWDADEMAPATGYQVRYSLYKSMSSAKTVKAAADQTSLELKLTAGKKYYVQIRTVAKNTVTNADVYSAWSTAAPVTISK